MQKRQSKDTSGSGSSKPTFREAYKLVEVNREQLVPSPYNPRTISDDAKKRLREGLQRFGLVEPIIWNKRTGHIVGGHQRIAQIDAMHSKASGYQIKVAAVDLDEKSERELCIRLNNPTTQGEWDNEALKKLFAEDGIDPSAAGFSDAELYQMFGDSVFADKPEGLDEISKQVEESRAAYKKLLEGKKDRDSVNFYAVLVFRNDGEREAFLTSCGQPNDKFVNGVAVADFIQGLQKSQAAPATDETPESSGTTKRSRKDPRTTQTDGG